jgi:hypothetical protein
MATITSVSASGQTTMKDYLCEIQLDSTRENRRQEEFNNRGAQVRRRVARRSVGWLCRRGGRRLRVCWPAGAGGRECLYRIDIGIVDTRSIWYTALIAIVVGHVLAVWLAHETAFAVLPDAGAARRGQYPMIVLMVAYTALSLWILAQPIVEPK